MIRKMKLIKGILQYVEAGHRDDALPVPEIDGYDDVQVHYHVGLCVDAGYMVAPNPKLMHGKRVFGEIERLTWAGHEALDRLRKEGCGR